MKDRYSIKCDRKALCWIESAATVLDINKDPDKEEGYIVSIEFEGSDHELAWTVGDYVSEYEKENA